MKKFFSIIAITVFALNNAQNQEMKSYIDNLMSKMTLEEKIGQLNLPTSGDIVTGQGSSMNIKERIALGQVGGLFNIKSVPKIREMQEIAVNKTRLKIPLIIGMDVIHGYETTFPIPLGLSCTWDIKAIEQSARIAAQEATADGINWTFSPMIDIARDPRWGRIAEGSGEDPFLGSEIAKAMVKGYQGKSLSENNTMLSCAKHFALYGAAEAGRDYNTVDMSKQQMYNVYFPPFKAAVEAGIGTFMASFNEVDGIPATGNKWLLTDVLRNQWNFNGFVVTDYTGINEMVEHGVGNFQDCAKQSLQAGVDMDMVSDAFSKYIPQAIKENKIDIRQVDQAVRRILEAKYKLGLFENPYKYLDENRAQKEIFTKENRQVARKIASQSFVLLKNDKQTLPLSPQGKIAFIGPLVDEKVHMAGTWAVATKLENAVSLLTGIQETVGTQIEILTAKGCNLDYNEELEKRAGMFNKKFKRDTRSKEVILQEAKDIASQADVVVLALGEGAEMSGESSSRTSIELPQSQKDLISALQEIRKPLILVLFTGRPLDLSDEVNKVDAILNVWFPGTEAGYAISDVLFGNENPSGKLTTTFPRSIGQIPIYYNYKNTGRPLEDNKIANCEFEKFKSNFIDECNTPLFPFGYGLSYTHFEYNNFKLNAEKLQGNQTLKAYITITNRGNYDGYETAQLYIRDKVGSTTRPVKELKGFQKIFLKKGESRTIIFDITPELLKFYNYDLKYDWESGEFDVMIGKNSSDVQTKTILWNK